MQNSKIEPYKNISIYKVIKAKPFLKWAGGKTQLLDELDKRLPANIKIGGIIERYVEPFIGGGAFFFFLKRKYCIRESYLFDINRELIIGYKAIQNNVYDLIFELDKIENKYTKMTEEERKRFYYKIRDEYNRQKDTFDYENYNGNWIKRGAYLIFLNKTCFNGLYRQNKKGEFNVPFGKYNNPKICDRENLLEVYEALKDTYIFACDFEESKKFIRKDTLVYLDPPYRPLNSTSNFTSYDKDGFNDNDQVRLAKFYKAMDIRGAFLLLSNSDPKNEDINDNFFDELYSDYKIERVNAKRYINSNAKKRGSIRELIISNCE